MTTLVTGGGGFLGSCIVKRLLQEDHQVRVINRSEYPELKKLGVETVLGDLRSLDDINKACEGVDIVYHVAAKAGIWGSREDYFSINVDGTRNVIEACRNNNVKKLVFTSSPSVVFGEKALAGVDETIPYPEHYLAYYPESKAEAERLVLKANSKDLFTCALRPHLIWGPGDPHLVPRLLETARKNKLMQVGDGSNIVDITFVENAADAHILAGKQLEEDEGVRGQAFFIGDKEPVNLWNWINSVLKSMDVKPVAKTISYKTAFRIGSVLEFFYRHLRLSGEPRMTRFVASQLSKSHYFDCSKAHKKFNYSPSVTNEEGMNRLISWLKESKI